MAWMRDMALRTVGWSAAGAVSFLLATIVVGAFGPLPEHILGSAAHDLSTNDMIKAESDIRSSLLQAVGGVLLIVGALTAWRQMLIGRRQHLLSRRVAVTEAFTKAVEQLGNTGSAAIRLGGLYSLDRVAGDDPSERTRVAEIIAAFIRESTTDSAGLSSDVLAALDILTRRKWPSGVDLADVKLPGVRLTVARLRNARLSRADLRGAALNEADLRSADLSNADLRNAHLSGADLRDARLAGTRLSGASADAMTQWPQGFNPLDHGVLDS
jgi:hypothetical protein